MAITTSVLKIVRQQAVVKMIGNGTATIDLASIKKSDETFLGYANTNVTIKTVIYSTDGNASNPITVSRNGSNIMYLYGNDTWEFDQGAGFVDSSNTSANVVVTMPTNATFYVVLGKLTGYEPPNLQTAPN